MIITIMESTLGGEWLFGRWYWSVKRGSQILKSGHARTEERAMAKAEKAAAKLKANPPRGDVYYTYEAPDA